MDNTNDLSLLGIYELRQAGRLLSMFKTEFDLSDLGEGVKIEYNPNSGLVFLVDSDFNVGMFDGVYIRRFHSCPECGFEGYSHQLLDDGDDCCKEYIKEAAVDLSDADALTNEGE